MKREELYYIIAEQQKEFLQGMDQLVQREALSKVLKLTDAGLPIVITGIRRCGKSTLLKLIKNKLKKKKKEYLYLNFNDERLINFSAEDFQKIIDYLGETDYKKNCFLFLDEIQEVNFWEKWIDRILHKYKIFITGSNSRLLSKEISSVLTGRSINVQLFPFSFTEYLTYEKVDWTNWQTDLDLQSKIRKYFKQYLVSGGLPYFVVMKQDVLVSELYQNIIYRDIVGRFNKNLTKQIKELSLFLLSNATSPISLRTLSNISNITNLATVKQITELLESSFLYFSINKFDYSLKKQLQNPKKIFCTDNGFMSVVGFHFSEDKGKLLENLTAIELIKNEDEVYYHADKKECDFVIKTKRTITQAIQVSYDLTENNKEREINGLVDALKKYNLKNGLVLTLDEENTFNHKGFMIEIKPFWKWLLLQLSK